MDIVFASLALSLIGVFVKNLNGGASPYFILWFRSLAHIAFLTPLIFSKGFEIRLKKSALLRGLCGFVGMGLYFLTLQKLPLMLATSIFWTAPLFTLAGAVIFQGKRLEPREAVPGVLIALGIVLLFLDYFRHSTSAALIPLILAVISSICIGGSYFFLGQLGSAKESPLSVTFSFSYLIFLFATPVAIFQIPSHLGLKMLATLAGVSVCAIIYQFFITRAYSKKSTVDAASIQAAIVPLLSFAQDAVLFKVHASGVMMIAVGLLLAGQLIKSGVFNHLGGGETCEKVC